MGMSPYQNAGRGHNINTDNISFERAEDLKYFGTSKTNQNVILEEIRSRLKSGKACYHLVQNFIAIHFAIQKYKDCDIQNTNIACCFVWV